MCPKGDDPLTTNQNYRKIKMRVKSWLDVLSGKMGLRFQGKTIFFTLETFDSPNVTCNNKFAFQGKFGHVGCTQVTHSNKFLDFELTFYSWPVYPKDNNLYVNDGNPSIDDFFCDVSFSSRGSYCEFHDLSIVNIKGMLFVLCSANSSCQLIIVLNN
jgi:hypothetical protein